MLGTLLRVLIGFALACVTAGVTVVLHIVTPADLANLSGDALNSRLIDSGILALRAATHIAIFAAPFALILAAVSEWQAVRSLLLYILAGVAVAGAGFLAQHWSESTGQPTIFNDYAIRAFLTSGAVGGLVYWLIAGRCAGAPDRTTSERQPEISHK